MKIKYPLEKHKKMLEVLKLKLAIAKAEGIKKDIKNLQNRIRVKEWFIRNL